MTALNPSHNCGRIYFFLAASRCERLCGLLNGRRKSFSFLMQHSFHLAAAATQLSSELLVHNVITCIPSVRQQEIVPSADCHLGSPCVSVLCSVSQTTSSVKRLIYRALMTKFSAHFEKAKWSANVREVLRTGDSKNFWSCGATVFVFFTYLLFASLQLVFYLLFQLFFFAKTWLCSFTNSFFFQIKGKSLKFLLYSSIDSVVKKTKYSIILL